MPATRTNEWVSTPLSKALQNYLEQKHITQQALADYLSVDVRNFRRWLSGQTVITDVRELKRIADLLEVAPESLGVAASLYVPLTTEQVDTATESIWKLVKAARYYEANALVDKLIRDVTSLIHTEDTTLLRKLASAQHIAGYVKSQTTRSNETGIPFSHYSEMERIARLLDDQTLLNVA